MAAALRSGRFIAPALALSIGAGGFAGVSGGVDLVGDDSHLTARTPASIHYSACPDWLSAGTLAPGDRVYLVGRSVDEQWLEMRSPGDLLHTVWVRREQLKPDRDVAALPVRDCPASGGELLVVDGALPGATTTTTTVDPAPSTTIPSKPDAPGALTTTSTTGPAAATIEVSGLRPSSRFVYEDIPDCPGPFTLTLSARITGADVEVVRVQIRLHEEWASPIRMTDPDGDERFTASVGPFPYPTVADGDDVEVAWRVTAIDARGNTTTATAAPADRFTIRSAAACII